MLSSLNSYQTIKEIIIENTGAKYSEMLVKLVEYFDDKLQHFAEYTNIIVDFSIENNVVRVKSQTM